MNGLMSSRFVLAMLLVLFADRGTTTRSMTVELLTNGDFEEGTGVGWRTYAVASGPATSAGIVDLGNARRGSWYAYVGDMTPASSSARGVLRQDIDVPADTESLELTFYLNITSDEAVQRAFDFFSVNLRDFNDRVLETVVERDNTDKDPSGNKRAYRKISRTIEASEYAGRRIILQFYAETDANLATTFRIDDVQLLATIRAEPLRHTVNASSGPHGRITPHGEVLVESGDDQSFVARPDTGYEIDYWLVDGIIDSTAGEQYEMHNVLSNHEIRVHFKTMTHTVVTSAAHGMISLNPQLNTYPHGGQVDLHAVPNPGYYFAGWRLNDRMLDVSQSIRLSVNNDMSIEALFRRQPGDINIRVAQSTPQTSRRLELELPALEGLDYVLQRTDDWQQWEVVSISRGEESQAVTPEVGGKEFEAFRTQQVQRSKANPFLRFPLNGATAYNSPVTAVCDHNLGEGPYHRNGAILTCVNQSFTASEGTVFTEDRAGLVPLSPDPKSPLFYAAKHHDSGTYIHGIVGFKHDGRFQAPFNYIDGHEILWYDGHPGYDYRAGFGTSVLSASTGKIVSDQSDDCSNAICIETVEPQSGERFRIYYLHLAERSSALTAGGRLIDGFDVSEGDAIGTVGDSFCNGTIGVHLHFEIRRWNSHVNAWEVYDPYGFRLGHSGEFVQPALWR